MRLCLARRVVPVIYARDSVVSQISNSGAQLNHSQRGNNGSKSESTRTDLPLIAVPTLPRADKNSPLSCRWRLSEKRGDTQNEYFQSGAIAKPIVKA